MRIDYNKLTADVTDALIAHGLNDEQAKILASSFVAATAAGVATHGVSMLGAYLKKLTLGQLLYGFCRFIRKRTGNLYRLFAKLQYIRTCVLLFKNRK